MPNLIEGYNSWNGLELITNKKRFVRPFRKGFFELLTEEFEINFSNELNKKIYIKLNEKPQSIISIKEINGNNILNYLQSNSLENLTYGYYYYSNVDFENGYFAVVIKNGNPNQKYKIIVEYYGLGSIISAEEINQLKTGEFVSEDYKITKNLNVPNKITIGEVSINSYKKGISTGFVLDNLNVPLFLLQNENKFSIISPTSIEISSNLINSQDRDYVWLGSDEYGTYLENAFEEPFYIWLAAYNSKFYFEQNSLKLLKNNLLSFNISEDNNLLEINHKNTNKITLSNSSFKINLNNLDVFEISSSLIDVKNKRITNVQTPTNANDVATKSYVDSSIAGFAWQKPVRSIVSSLPSNPQIGDRYLINSGTNVNKIAEWDGSQWIYYTPSSNWAVFVSDTDKGYTYNSELASSFKWITFTALNFPDGSSNQTLRHDGTNWVANSSLIITSSGNVGVNVSNPSEKLEVSGNIGFRSGANSFIGTLDNYALSFRTNNTERMVITNVGRIGFGVSSPAAVYHFYTNVSDVSPFRLESTAANPVIELKDSSSSQNLSPAINFLNSSNLAVGQIGFHTSNKIITFNIDATTRMVITSSGNVGIGISSPTQRLDIDGNIKFSNSLICGNGIIKYDTDNKWKYSNDGVNFFNFVNQLESLRWIKFTLSFNDFISQNPIQLYFIPEKGILHGIKIKHNQVFSGGTIYYFKIGVGIYNNFNKYAGYYEIGITNPVNQNNFYLSNNFIAEDDMGWQVWVRGIAYNSNMTEVQVSQLTQGSVDIWLLISQTY